MNRTSFRLILTLSLTLLTACGKGFKAQDSLEDSFDPKISLNDGNGGGNLGWTETETPSKDLQYQFEMKVPFGRVYKLASKAVRLAAPFACRWVDSLDQSPMSSYADGEFACGEVVDSQWKRLLTVQIDPMGGQYESFSYLTSGATLPVLVSRQVRQGSFSESSLDSKSVVNLTSSAQFAEDISLRFVPNQQNARLEMCVNIPGATVTTTPQSVWAKAWTYFNGVKLSYDSSFNINPGSASFDYGRGCFAVDFGWQGEQLNPTVQFQATQAPLLANVQYQGLQITTSDWFLNLVERISSAFEYSLKDKLIQRLSKIANKMADKDVETGRWFTRVHGDELLAQTGERLNNRVSRVMTRVGMPTSASDLRVMLKDQCRLKKLSLSPEWTLKLAAFCQDVVDQVEISIAPFAVDSASKAAGCYEHFARLHDSSGKWWAEQCKFASKFSVKLPAHLKDYGKELTNLLAAHVSTMKLPTEWTQALAQNNIDSYTLVLLLEELEKRGYSQILPSDWSNNIPTIIQELKQRLGDLQI